MEERGGRLLQVPGEAGRKRQRVGLVDLLKGCLMPVRDPPTWFI
jgi:hypothetical protein